MALLGLLALAVYQVALAAPMNATESHIEVLFVEPEKYTDISENSSTWDQPSGQLLKELCEYLQHAGRNYLKPGQHLTVRITDIDLAGAFEPWHGPDFDHIRILKEIYPPAMKLEFQLTGPDGKVVTGGKRELRQLGYQMTTGLPTWDPLRYDKEMLRSWLSREFKDG